MKSKSDFLTGSDSAFSYAAQLCARFGSSNEFGGLGVGSYDEAGNPVVMALLPPGPNAVFSPASFIDDADYVNTAVDHAKTHFGIAPICWWHLHPGDYSEPSPIDLVQCQRFTRKLKLPRLGYMIMTRQNCAVRHVPLWGKCFSRFTGKKTPVITVYCYLFDSALEQYEPCFVKTINYCGIQHDFLNANFIPRLYKLPFSYPPDKIVIINKVESDLIIPSSFTEAYRSLAALVPPEIFVDGDTLTAVRVFDNGTKLCLRYRFQDSGYHLLDGSVQTDKISQDITKRLRFLTRFDQAYLEACHLATSIKRNEYYG